MDISKFIEVYDWFFALWYKIFHSKFIDILKSIDILKFLNAEEYREYTYCQLHRL